MSPRDFRYQLSKAVEPVDFLDAVARDLSSLLPPPGADLADIKIVWAVDTKADRFISMSCQVKPGRAATTILAMERFAQRIGGMFTWGRRYDDLAPANRVQVLSAQCFPTAMGADLQVRGAGPEAQKVADDLVSRLEAMTDADVRRLAHEDG